MFNPIKFYIFTHALGSDEITFWDYDGAGLIKSKYNDHLSYVESIINKMIVLLKNQSYPGMHICVGECLPDGDPDPRKEIRVVFIDN